MNAVYCIGTNIFSPLAKTTNENFQAVIAGNSGVHQYTQNAISSKKFAASLFDTKDDLYIDSYSFFESLIIHSVKDVVLQSGINISEKTGFILASTKGNISTIEAGHSLKEKESISLFDAAKRVADYFNISSKPIIISQACISGVVAINTAKRLIENNIFEELIVVGADVITQFILSGFQSFMAVSDELCKPFDVSRCGINLGEAAASIVLSKNANQSKIRITGGAVSNDANHISGPSRTGVELNQAIEKAIQESKIDSNQIDFISAHGTATVYNDDMESKAFTLSQLNHIPVNSLKGYFGHTLGAAGILETVISIASLQNNIIVPTRGFEHLGTDQSINICQTIIEQSINTCLKTASGFGGCNAAIIIQKENI